MKIVDQKALIELYQGYFDFREMKWPEVREAVHFAITEIIETVDALKRQQAGWVRHNDRDRDLGMEITQTIMMLMIALDGAGIDFEEKTYAWMKSKGYAAEYWAGKDFVLWAYPTENSRQVHLWGKIGNVIQSACGLEFPSGHNFGTTFMAGYPKREPTCNTCLAYWTVKNRKGEAESLWQQVLDLLKRKPES
jgi:hypothetical protein